jgi:Rps23 Pro-64 3,4-dihydroxylase Tpa1-like proline 4-hydroxylase
MKTHHHVKNFLDQAQYDEIKKSALAQTYLDYDPSGKDTVNRGGLRPCTTTCFEWAYFALFETKLYQQVRDAVRQFHPDADIASKIGQVELTKMISDGHLLPHIDGDYADVRGQLKLTFVYYVADRSSFTGGQLRLTDSNELIEPEDNSIVVFFGSHVRHEVLPVRGPEAKRITVNGWFPLLNYLSL